MTLNPVAQRHFRQVNAVYALQTQGQVTAVNVEHPLYFQLDRAARLLYALAFTETYQSFSGLAETARRLLDFTALTGGSGILFDAKAAWTTMDHQNLGLIRHQAREQPRLVMSLTVAIDVMNQIRKHPANLLMPELVRLLRRTPAKQSGADKAFLVIVQHGGWIPTVEKALQEAGLNSTTRVATRAAAKAIPITPPQTLVVLGEFTRDDLPGLLTAPRSANVVLLRYARPEDTVHETGLFLHSADQVCRNATVHFVPGPEFLRELALPAVQVPAGAAPREAGLAGTPVSPTAAPATEPTLTLRDLEEDAAFLNGTLPTLPTRLNAQVEAWTMRMHDHEVQIAAGYGHNTIPADGGAEDGRATNQALLMTFNGGIHGPRFTFVDASRPVDVLVPDTDNRAEVFQQPGGELMAGQYLLLRTGAGALASRSLAKTQGGDAYRKAEALHLEWRTAFRRRVHRDDSRFADIANAINRCGAFQGSGTRVKKEDVSRWYRDETLKRPEDDVHFEALLEYAGFNVCGAGSRLQEFMQAMSQLVGAHISAGTHVTDALLASIPGRDVTTLVNHGVQTFSLDSQPGSGEFTVAEVLSVRPYHAPVNSTSLGTVFGDRATNRPDDT